MFSVENWLEEKKQDACVIAEFRALKALHSPKVFEEIAIGQSIGAWQETYVSAAVLNRKVARVVNILGHENPDSPEWVGFIEFPWDIWHGRLGDLLTLLYGKMSFYEGIQLSDVLWSAGCYEGAGSQSKSGQGLMGPVLGMDGLRNLVGSRGSDGPLLMGILKPNVGMAPEKICELYAQCAQAGLHVLKDDEIRCDASVAETAERVKLVAKLKEADGFKTLYAVHFQVRHEKWKDDLRVLEDAGAQCLLVNVWTAGIGFLQSLRRQTSLPLMAHPALVGAFGTTEKTATLHPRVTLAQFLRAAGADFSLFPSPYGAIGLSMTMARAITQGCNRAIPGAPHLRSLVAVPSAGVKPSHALQARLDFGDDFVLNAGTGIFAHKDHTPRQAISLFFEEFSKFKAVSGAPHLAAEVKREI